MVFFICSHCGASLKKSKVEKHYAIQCRNHPHVSCMDCHKEFSGNDYAAHTKCLTEDEKYSGKGFVPKPVASKQEEWLNIVRTVRKTQGQLSNNLKTLLDKIISFENIPRKKPKFMNFLNNNHLKINLDDLNLLWDLFEKEQKQLKESVAVENANKTAETESKDSSMEADQEAETSPKKKKKKEKDTSESKSQIIDSNQKYEAEEMESEEVTPPVKTNKNKDKKKRKSDAVDDSVMKVPVEVPSEEPTQVKKAKKKKNSLESTEAVNSNEVEEPAKMQIEEITQDTRSEEVALTKKQRKEKKKREKYEAELKEIGNSQPTGILPEDDADDEQNKGKKKSKKDKHVNGLDNYVNGISERKTGESVLKAKKKRSLEDDSADTMIEKKKKKGDIQDADQTEETAVVNQNTIPQQKFNWNEIILEVVKSKGGEIPMKRLRKKVLSEYVNSCGAIEGEEKLGAKFSKKLQKVPGITIHKEVVMLV